MVADQVTVVTRRAGEETGWRLGVGGRRRLHDRRGVARRRRAPRSRCTSSRPTREDALEDFTDATVIRGIVRKYSDFVAYPIKLRVEEPTARPTRAQEARRRGRRDQLDEGDLDAPRRGGERRGVQRVLPAHQPRLGGAAQARADARRGDQRVPRAALHPAPRALGHPDAHGRPRHPALRPARLHHERLQGADPRVPALRARRGRLRGPVPQHLARDSAEEPPDPADPQGAW